MLAGDGEQGRVGDEICTADWVRIPRGLGARVESSFSNYAPLQRS